MSNNNEDTQKFRDGLASIGDALEAILDREPPAPEIYDRSLSGNKINGGMITNFSSKGIKDLATQHVITVDDNGILVASARINTIDNPLTVNGDLTVNGQVNAHRLHVNEITADIRNERSSPLEFTSDKGYAVGKGLIWPGPNGTKQFVLQGKEPKLFSSESIDLFREKDYQIGGVSVLSTTELGPTVRNSNLTSVGTLNGLSVDGRLIVDNFLYFDADTQRLGLGTAEPNGSFSIRSWEHEFIVDDDTDQTFKIGSWSTTGLKIVTDNTPRIELASDGGMTLHEKVVVKGSVGINVNNYQTDADLTVRGPIRFQSKKFESANAIPIAGHYKLGDIVWNSSPSPTSYVGWICVREGSPGEWKPFGQISS